MKQILSAAFLFVLAAAGATAARAQTLGGSIGNGTVARGGSARGTVVMDIPKNLHVNSNRPGSEYAIATTVRLTAAGAKTGAVGYPRGRSRKFAFSDETLNVYENRTAFNFNLTVPANFKGNVVRVRAVVRYQACTEEVCYPPKSQEITLTAKVR